MPSEYLPIVWGGELPDENAFASLEDANATLQLIMRHWNSIVSELEADGVYAPVIGEPDERGVAGRGWARGFMRGLALRREGWKEIIAREDEGQLLTIPMVAGENLGNLRLRQQLPGSRRVSQHIQQESIRRISISCKSCSETARGV